MKTVFLDLDTIDNDDLDLTDLRAAVSDLQTFATTTDADIVERIGDAEGVFINKVHLDRATFEACPALRFVCMAATGTDSVDLEAARDNNVAVYNIRDYCTASVVQHVFALVLTLVRSLDGYRILMSRGAWKASPQFCLLGLPIRDLADMTLGVVGHGTLGAAVARLAEGFGMRVLIAALRRETAGAGRVPFDEVLDQCDVLTLHCPLTESNRGLLGEKEFARMKKGAIVVNTARGGLIDSAALAAALRSGHLAGAGIDVLPEEPPVHGDPLLEDDVPNLIVTPHIAWASAHARQRAIDAIVANVAAYKAGERRNRIV